ncbi:hypothetical protein QQX98_012920 [Neonectria punicea]|uniref:Nephrocystin 3-like N-terminal domain-containing protein n=1 Tax=Neonectria punicea TaxID=979145 RepID=A0ABR1GHJ5_9HYPO
MVPGTCTWFFAEKDETRSPFLAVNGEPGTGKGHLAAAIYDHLGSRFREGPNDKDDNCVAHFYFRDDRKSLADFDNAIASVVYQVSEQSTSAGKLIHRKLCCRRILEEVDVTEWKELLDELLAPLFHSGSKRQLFIVFDGFDELKEDHRESFTEFLADVADRRLRIYVCFTSQPGVTRINGEQDEPICLGVVMAKQKQLPDIKALAWDRVNGLDGLKNFSRYVKQRITEKVEEVAPSESMKWNSFSEKLIGRFKRSEANILFDFHAQKHTLRLAEKAITLAQWAQRKISFTKQLGFQKEFSILTTECEVRRATVDTLMIRGGSSRGRRSGKIDYAGRQGKDRSRDDRRDDYREDRRNDDHGGYRTDRHDWRRDNCHPDQRRDRDNRYQKQR